MGAADIDAQSIQTGTIETDIPARLDRLPWSRFHWRVIVGLGTVWILDGLEVTIISSISGRLSEKGAGVGISAADVSGLAATLYVAGACFGALVWGGAIGGGLLALLALNTSVFPIDLGWRLCFALGAVLGTGVLLIRRNVPESPRWLFIHGREEEAEEVVAGIEREVREQHGEELPKADESIRVRQRKTIPLALTVRSVLTLYPRRTILGLALFIGQAFLYNAILFSLGYLLKTFFGVASGNVPYYLIVFSVGNLLGPLTLGRLFDTVGRKPMIAGCYLLSGALLVVTAFLFKGGQLTAASLVVALMIVFFFASAGVSAAYLTVSEIFPLETRALCISVFYAVGTGVGGIVGPLLFAHLIESGKTSEVAIGFLIGAVAMILGGVAELIFGVKAEGMSLESIARPLTVADADGSGSGPAQFGERPMRASL